MLADHRPAQRTGNLSLAAGEPRPETLVSATRVCLLGPPAGLVVVTLIVTPSSCSNRPARGQGGGGRRHDRGRTRIRVAATL